MSDCKCESVKIYDGEHRCMKCYKRFAPLNEPSVPTFSGAGDYLGDRKLKHYKNHGPRYFIYPEANCSELARLDQRLDAYVKTQWKPKTRRSDNLPLGVKPNES